MKSITIKEIEDLRSAGRVVVVYPRKRLVCVDGFKYFRLKGAR